MNNTPPALVEELPGLQTGQAAFAQGDFQTAYRIFQQLARHNPSDPELDFFLGRSAFEIDDYEAAVFALC